MAARIPAQGKRLDEQTGVKITLENELFDLIRSRAAKARTSFNEQVRILLEWGLDAADRDK